MEVGVAWGGVWTSQVDGCARTELGREDRHDSRGQQRAIKEALSKSDTVRGTFKKKPLRYVKECIKASVSQ